METETDMILNPPRSNTAHGWSYHPDTQTFTVEASTLRGYEPGFDLGRVYDDACDEGFTLVSHRTGLGIVFSQDGVDHDREGDVAGWRFVCVTPAFKCFRALIIND